MFQNQVQDYLLNKPKSILDHPFGDDIKVFKVKNKMFATLALGKIAKNVNKTQQEKQYWWLNLKCEPAEAVMLRDIFSSVIPGYHMNKRLWNTLILDGSIPQGEIERMMDNSYLLVVSNMTKKDQTSLMPHL